MHHIVRKQAILALAWMGGACTSAPGAGREPYQENTGTIGMQLQVAPGIAIDAVTYVIQNPNVLTSNRTGTFDVSQSSAIQFYVGGLPPGDGYTVALTAQTTNGWPCQSDPAPFSIASGQTTGVAVALVCTPALPVALADAGALLVDATITLAEAGPACPAVASLTALPSEIDVGGSLQLAAAAGSADAVLTWSAAGADGTLSTATGPMTTFTCAGAGSATVSVTATVPNTPCDASATVVVTCDAVAADAAAVEDGESEGETGDGASTDAAEIGCLVPGTYSIPITGSECTTTVANPSLPMSACTATVSPISTTAMIQATFDPASGWTLLPEFGLIGAGIVSLTPTPTGFTGTSLVDLGAGAPCQTNYTVDCQDGTISVATPGCILQVLNGCSNMGSTECEASSEVVPVVTGIGSAISESGTAALGGDL